MLSSAPAHSRAWLGAAPVIHQSCRHMQAEVPGPVPALPLAHHNTIMLQEGCSPSSECCSLACRSKTRQILGVDLRRWTLLGIIVILVILLISLVARLRGAQPRTLPQVQVQGGWGVVLLLLGAQVASTCVCAVLQALAGVSAHQRCCAGTAPQ